MRLLPRYTEERVDVAFGVTILLLLVQLPVLAIPIVGPLIYATISSYIAGAKGGEYVEKPRGPYVAFAAVAFFYTIMSVIIIAIIYSIAASMPGDINPLDLYGIGIIVALIVISGIFASIGGYKSSKAEGYFEV